MASAVLIVSVFCCSTATYELTLEVSALGLGDQDLADSVWPALVLRHQGVRLADRNLGCGQSSVSCRTRQLVADQADLDVVDAPEPQLAIGQRDRGDDHNNQTGDANGAEHFQHHPSREVLLTTALYHIDIKKSIEKLWQNLPSDLAIQKSLILQSHT